MFTGDSSGDWLFRALYETGFANQPESYRLNDGLKLKSVYITAVAHCAPPKNKPSPEEIKNCSEYLLNEIGLLNKVKITLTLGRIAFDTTICHVYHMNLGHKPSFRHGGFYRLDDGHILFTSYHPSRQNTQTGRLTWKMWISVFERIKEILG